ncbi:restriction endonuclease subunit S [Microcoleus sp. S28C3]|uniref:restriction endonuclease subunit S n=1 Tax=Microcoleus sp. S28C3 TaxID=3055414 RepID=UPI002FD2FAC3
MQLTVDTEKLAEGWVKKSLADLIKISHGYAFKGADFEKSDDITKPIVLTPGNYSESGELYFTSQNTKRLTGSVPPSGYLFDVGELTVVMTDLSSKMKILGKPAFINQPNILHNQRIGRIYFKDKSIVPQFLYYFFRTRVFADKIKETATGTMVRHTAPNRILANKICVPPILEQKRIVAILDEAFEGIDRAIANTEKNLANARELFESYLNTIFTQEDNEWEWVSLSEITTDITDGDHQAPPKSEFGIPFITISNINKQNRQVDFSNTFKVPHEYFEKIKINRKPRKGDLLYTVTGSYGIPVIVDYDIDFCFQRHIGLIRPNSETNSKCLYYILLSRYLLNQADKCATGAAQKTVSLSGLRRFSVPKIPKQKQEIIVAKLDNLLEQITRLETIYSKKIAALNELKQSILQKAFTGELTADTSKTVKEKIAA